MRRRAGVVEETWNRHGDSQGSRRALPGRHPRRAIKLRCVTLLVASVFSIGADLARWRMMHGRP
jgi:hypothetical protein